MKDLNIMNTVMHEKAKDIVKNGNPVMDEENEKVFERKRISIDQPYQEVKFDPLR